MLIFRPLGNRALDALQRLHDEERMEAQRQEDKMQKEMETKVSFGCPHYCSKAHFITALMPCRFSSNKFFTANRSLRDSIAGFIIANRSLRLMLN